MWSLYVNKNIPKVENFMILDNKIKNSLRKGLKWKGRSAMCVETCQMVFIMVFLLVMDVDTSLREVCDGNYVIFVKITRIVWLMFQDVMNVNIVAIKDAYVLV